MIDPATGWFNIFEIPIIDLEELALGNYEYIDKLSARVSQSFNNTWLCRCTRPRKVVFGNVSEFKRYFTPLLKDFDIKPVLTSVGKPHDNAQLEWVHQVIIKMLFTKDLDKKVFEYIDPWCKTIASIAWVIIASYNGNTRPRCLWQVYIISPRVSCWLASYNCCKAAPSRHW